MLAFDQRESHSANDPTWAPQSMTLPTEGQAIVSEPYSPKAKTSKTGQASSSGVRMGSRCWRTVTVVVNGCKRLRIGPETPDFRSSTPTGMDAVGSSQPLKVCRISRSRSRFARSPR
jgi:hypothetical protein